MKVNTNDHNPPHVHVRNANGAAKFNLSVDGSNVELVKVIGMSDKEISEAGQMVADNNGFLLTEWRRIHQ